MDAREDQDIVLFKRLLRLFQVRTHLDERFVLKRLDPEAQRFIQSVVPLLVKAGVLLSEVNEKDKQHWFRLTMPMERIYQVLQKAGKSMDSFLAEVEQKSS